MTMTLVLICAGARSLNRSPVDAYPRPFAADGGDHNPMSPVRRTEEVERLITVPIELEMNGIPHINVVRSISLYGLSDVILTYDDNSDIYFARQRVYERIADLKPAEQRCHAIGRADVFAVGLDLPVCDAKQ